MKFTKLSNQCFQRHGDLASGSLYPNSWASAKGLGSGDIRRSKTLWTHRSSQSDWKYGKFAQIYSTNGKGSLSIAYQTHGYAWIMWIRNMMKIESLSSTGCRENSTWNLEFRRLVEWAIILGELHSTTTYNTNIYSNICTKTEKPCLHVQVGVEAPADCEQNSVPESTVEKWAICGKWNCDPNITPLHTFLQQNHPFRSLCLTLKRYFFHCSWHSFSEAMIWASSDGGFKSFHIPPWRLHKENSGWHKHHYSQDRSDPCRKCIQHL